MRNRKYLFVTFAILLSIAVVALILKRNSAGSYFANGTQTAGQASGTDGSHTSIDNPDAFSPSAGGASAEKSEKQSNGDTATVDGLTISVGDNQPSKSAVSQSKSQPDQTVPDLRLGENVHKAVGEAWDNFPVDVHFHTTDKAEVSAAFNNLTVDGTPLDDEQIGCLKTTFVELVFDYGNEDIFAWLRYLKSTGETISDDRVAAARQLLESGGFSSTTQASDGWSLIERLVVANKMKTHWKGLTTSRGSSVHIAAVDAAHMLPAAGSRIQTLRSHEVTYGNWSTPPISILSILQSGKSILFADVTFFILHSDDFGGHTQPYVLRCWYDGKNKVWRPFTLSYFPDQDQAIDSNRGPIF